MKDFKIYVGAVALFALVVVNVWNAATTLQETELSVADVEAMANPEGQGGSGAIPGKMWVSTATKTLPGVECNSHADGSREEIKHTVYEWYCDLRESGSSNCKWRSSEETVWPTITYKDNTGHYLRTQYICYDPDGTNYCH